MPLRLRLALWYGALTGLVVITIAVLAYAIHVRTHYDQVDATLEGAAEHTLAEYVRAQDSGASFEPLNLAVGPDVPVRIYGTNETVLTATPSSAVAPEMQPSSILSGGNEAPYDLLAQLIPISLYEVDIDDGNFGLVTDADGNRWRVVVLRLPEQAGFVVAMNSLSSIDDSIFGVRWLLSTLALGGLGVTLAGGWVLAGRALQPVRELTDTAGAIARLRAFGRRVPVRGTDELADMSATFNLMLDELAAAYRMQQRFVSDASHELRAPLTTIQANLEFLSRHPGLDDAERQEVVRETEHETVRLSRLVADLLALARADSGMQLRRDDIELDRLVLEVVRDARSMIQSEQALTIEGIEPAGIEGDPDRIKQLLIIIIDNAIKYTPRDGNIGITLRGSGQSAEIVVADSGVGIPSDDLPHVFDRFYRGDPARTRDPSGTGLGLAIAKWIVGQHSGTIVVDSDVKSGTTVTVRLPMKLQQSDTP